MKSLITTFLLVILFILAAKPISAQTLNFNVSQIAQPTYNLLDTMWAKKYHFQIPDTTNISKIHLKMGTTMGGNEVFQYSFTFDQDTLLPVGFNYQRNNSEVSISVGAYSLGYYHYEVKLEDTSGIFTSPARLNSSIH